jgi:hypothetical protein
MRRSVQESAEVSLVVSSHELLDCLNDQLAAGGRIFSGDQLQFTVHGSRHIHGELLHGCRDCFVWVEHFDGLLLTDLAHL